MSEAYAVMKLELLPNEILIECLKYLNAPDIFYSFDKLNYRFYQIIRNMPLRLNAQNFPKLTLDQFCANMLLNPEIKRRIVSLQLSRTIMYDPTHLFLSMFSLTEFPHIQSLKLIGIDNENACELASMLPLLPNLRYFYLTGEIYSIDLILKALGMSKIHTLSMSTLSCSLFSPNLLSSVTSIVISYCSAEILWYFFRYVPMLQYIKVGIMILDCHIWGTTQWQYNEPAAIHLKQLIVNNFTTKMNGLEKVLKQTPNLQRLTISVGNDREIIDACRWQKLITSSLPHLHTFKFKFTTYSSDNNDMLPKFQEFQTDFWHTQHHWHTAWEFRRHQASIYTIPYVLHNYVLQPNSKRYPNMSVVNSNIFDRVTDLILYMEQITENCEYYFSNVRSLRLESNTDDGNYDYPLLETKHVGYLKMTVNFDNVIDLDISSNIGLKSPFVLLQILKEAPHLSSMKIKVNLLISLFNNRELCQYFNKVIKRLDVVWKVNWANTDDNMVMKIFEIFSNIEEFRCDVSTSDQLLVILNALSKLPNLTLFYFRRWVPTGIYYWLLNHTAELNAYPFTVESGNYSHEEDDGVDEYDDDYV